MTSVPADDHGPRAGTRGRRGKAALRRAREATRIAAVPALLACLTTPDAVIHAKLFKLNMIAGNIAHHYLTAAR